MSSLTIPIQHNTGNPTQPTKRGKKKKQKAYGLERKKENSLNSQIIWWPMLKTNKQTKQRLYNKVPRTNKSLTKL